MTSKQSSWNPVVIEVMMMIVVVVVVSFFCPKSTLAARTVGPTGKNMIGRFRLVQGSHQTVIASICLWGSYNKGIYILYYYLRLCMEFLAFFHMNPWKGPE